MDTYNNVDELQDIIRSKNCQTQKEYTALFHLDEVLKQAKLIYSIRSQDRSYLWRERGE